MINTDLQAVYWWLYGPPELVPDPSGARKPDGSPRYVRNPAALSYHQAKKEHEREKRCQARATGYRIGAGCIVSFDAFDAGFSEARRAGANVNVRGAYTGADPYARPPVLRRQPSTAAAAVGRAGR